MNPTLTIKILFSIIIAATIFHLSILAKIIPYEITWGGRLKSDAEMYAFETLSILVNFILGITLLMKGNYIKQFVSLMVVNIILWVFLVLFGFNTFGNLFAETSFEKLFSIVTLASSVLLWFILKAKPNQHTAV